MSRSVIHRWLMASSIVWFITRIASKCVATQCEKIVARRAHCHRTVKSPQESHELFPLHGRQVQSKLVSRDRTSFDAHGQPSSRFVALFQSIWVEHLLETCYRAVVQGVSPVLHTLE
jgi:hypothetical protein